ncbi:hypothetical protein T492DRAFT_362210 [Pavlovales sp. CCMP2436]|nr:hypothetical protein T492DRAFT_362210 [Pavlovales sp. CCMP2436]
MARARAERPEQPEGRAARAGLARSPFALLSDDELRLVLHAVGDDHAWLLALAHPGITAFPSAPQQAQESRARTHSFISLSDFTPPPPFWVCVQCSSGSCARRRARAKSAAALCTFAHPLAQRSRASRCCAGRRWTAAGCGQRLPALTPQPVGSWRCCATRASRSARCV